MVKNPDIANYHVQYLDVTSQHWHPNSETFAGADNLLTALDNDWDIESCILKRKAFGPARFVKIYEFHLKRDDREMTMPVLANPYIMRWLIETEVTVEEDEAPSGDSPRLAQ